MVLDFSSLPLEFIQNFERKYNIYMQLNPAQYLTKETDIAGTLHICSTMMIFVFSETIECFLRGKFYLLKNIDFAGYFYASCLHCEYKFSFIVTISSNVCILPLLLRSEIPARQSLVFKLTR